MLIQAFLTEITLMGFDSMNLVYAYIYVRVCMYSLVDGNNHHDCQSIRMRCNPLVTRWKEEQENNIHFLFHNFAFSFSASI